MGTSGIESSKVICKYNQSRFCKFRDHCRKNMSMNYVETNQIVMKNTAQKDIQMSVENSTKADSADLKKNVSEKDSNKMKSMKNLHRSK